MSIEPTWTYHGISLTWRSDCFGHEGRALFVGRLCVGYIQDVSKIEFYDAPWRAWLVDDADDGKQLGLYKTEQEAKDDLIDAAIKALLQ